MPRRLAFRQPALDELDLQRLYGITGQYYRPLLDRFQQVGTSENNDTFTAKVMTGGAKGLYMSFEAIVMRGANGQLWAAYIDHEVVRYFTTEREFRERLPQTIEMWRGRFRDKNVVFANEIDAIPSIWSDAQPRCATILRQKKCARPQSCRSPSFDACAPVTQP